MKVYYSEKDPFLQKEIVFYVMSGIDSDTSPENYYSSKPELSRCFGSLQKALQACNDVYHYTIILQPGVYDETVTLDKKDLSKVTIQGVTTSNRSNFDGWLLNNAANSKNPTQEELEAEYLSVFAGVFRLTNCVLPSIQKVLLKKNPVRRLGHLFNYCSQSNRSILELISIDTSTSINNNRASFRFTNCQDIIIDNFYCYAKKCIEVSFNTTLYFSGNTFIEGILPTSKTSNFSGTDVIFVGFNSYVSFIDTTSAGKAHKIIKNGFMSVSNSSTIVNGIAETLNIDNLDISYLDDGSANTLDNIALTLYTNSRFISDIGSVLSTKGGTGLIKADNNCHVEFYYLSVQSDITMPKLMEICNFSSVRNLQNFNVNNTDIDYLIYCNNFSSYVQKDKKTINSSGLTEDKRVYLYAANNSYIQHESEFVFKGSNNYKRNVVYIPSLNTGYDTTSSRIYEKA